MGKKGPLWWRESDWLLRGSPAANQILLRHSGPILSDTYMYTILNFRLLKRLYTCMKYENTYGREFFGLF